MAVLACMSGENDSQSRSLPHRALDVRLGEAVDR